jgi:transposase
LRRLSIPKEVQKAPHDWRLIGGEVSEQLDYEPGQFLRRRLVRRKYVRRGDLEAPPVIAALPPSLQERCIAAPGLLAQIIVSKYCDHIPLYRQQAIFAKRHGVHLPRQNMARWMGLAADWLRPIYEHIRTGVMAEDTFKLTRLQFVISLPATAKPSSAISGQRYHLGAMWSITGKRAEQQTALET